MEKEFECCECFYQWERRDSDEYPKCCPECGSKMIDNKGTWSDRRY